MDEVREEFQNTETTYDTAPEAEPVRTPRRPSVWQDLLFLVLKIATIGLAFLLMFTFMFGLIRYQEPSMIPSIKDGDLVVFYRYTKAGYMPRDVVAMEFNGKKNVRRVVATAGDVVDITEDGLVINGALQQETDIYRKTERYKEGVDLPLTVPEGKVFVLADDRVGSADSRIYGPVSIEETLGKVMTVIRRRNF